MFAHADTRTNTRPAKLATAVVAVKALVDGVADVKLADSAVRKNVQVFLVLHGIADRFRLAPK